MMRRLGVILLLLSTLSACTQPQPLAEKTDTIDRSLNGAVALVRDYYADVNRGDYHRAYQRWGENGPPQNSVAAFADQFSDIRSVQLTVLGEAFMEGAAGSVYANIPIQLVVEKQAGTSQRQSGTAIVRRVNDVPGASDAQLHWHLYRLDLQPG